MCPESECAAATGAEFLTSAVGWSSSRKGTQRQRARSARSPESKLLNVDAPLEPDSNLCRPMGITCPVVHLEGHSPPRRQASSWRSRLPCTARRVFPLAGPPGILEFPLPSSSRKFRSKGFQWSKGRQPASVRTWAHCPQGHSTIPEAILDVSHDSLPRQEPLERGFESVRFRRPGEIATSRPTERKVVQGHLGDVLRRASRA